MEIPSDDYPRGFVISSLQLCVDGGDGQSGFFQNVQQSLDGVQRGEGGHAVFCFMTFFFLSKLNQFNLLGFGKNPLLGLCILLFLLQGEFPCL